MPYTPYTWHDDPAGGTPIVAERLNALEQGLAKASAIEQFDLSDRFAPSAGILAGALHIVRSDAFAAVTVAFVNNDEAIPRYGLIAEGIDVLEEFGPSSMLVGVGMPDGGAGVDPIQTASVIWQQPISSFLAYTEVPANMYVEVTGVIPRKLSGE